MSYLARGSMQRGRGAGETRSRGPSGDATVEPAMARHRRPLRVCGVGSPQGPLLRPPTRPSPDGDLTAESIIGAAIPSRRNSGRIPTSRGPCSAAFAAHTHRVGIDSQASSGRRRSEAHWHESKVNEAPA